jgi:hypothetical protein
MEVDYAYPPSMTVRLSSRTRDLFRNRGRLGGRSRARRLAPHVRSAIARTGASRRWIKARYGAAHFEALGLPAGALVDRGLDDLDFRRVTTESLLVSLAAPRLRREDVPLPGLPLVDADHRLHRLMEVVHGDDLAHARWLSLLRQVTSFADACGQARLDRPQRAMR